MATAGAADEWLRAGLRLLRAGVHGNALSVDLPEAMRLLWQQKTTRPAAAAALGASLSLMVLTVALFVAAPVAALAIGEGTGLLVGAAMGMTATAGLVYQVWRIPPAVALVRYEIVYP